MLTIHGRRPTGTTKATAGFSLIELLVVISLIVLLIALVAPALARSKEAARATTCLARLHNLHIATRLYADDYRTFPVAEPDDVLADLDLPGTTWKCLTDRSRAAAASEDLPYSSYTYLAPIYMDPPPQGLILAQLKPLNALRKYENNPRLPLFWDYDTWHDGRRNVVYWSGVAERCHWN